MSENSKIQWCDDTHNFWQGCTKVSPGCANCYAEARDQRFHGGTHWGPGAPRLQSKSFDAPLRWNEKPWVCEGCWNTQTHNTICNKCWSQRPNGNPTGFHRRRVFSLSLGDWLDPEVPIEWLVEMLDVIRRCPNLDFLLLTKRPELWPLRTGAVMRHLTPEGTEVGREPETWKMIHAWKHGSPPTNVWIGTTVENQEMADKRIPELLKIPAKVRFLSVEPMLGPVDLNKWIGPREFHFNGDEAALSDNPKFASAMAEMVRKASGMVCGIHWVIVGGESGPKARPFNIDWARSIVSQCKAAGVACFVKQMGAKPQYFRWEDKSNCDFPLKDSKGGDMSEWPNDLRIREFPCL